jgi:hypothetical protein
MVENGYESRLKAVGEPVSAEERLAHFVEVIVKSEPFPPSAEMQVVRRFVIQGLFRTAVEDEIKIRRRKWAKVILYVASLLAALGACCALQSEIV